MEPAPIVMVMGQGKETQGGEGREGAQSYQYICSACSDDGDELGFYLMEESHVDWSRISFLSNLLVFFLLLPVWSFAVGFIWSRQRNFDLVADVLWSTVGVCGRDSAR